MRLNNTSKARFNVPQILIVCWWQRGNGYGGQASVIGHTLQHKLISPIPSKTSKMHAKSTTGFYGVLVRQGNSGDGGAAVIGQVQMAFKGLVRSSHLNPKGMRLSMQPAAQQCKLDK